MENSTPAITNGEGGKEREERGEKMKKGRESWRDENEGRRRETTKERGTGMAKEEGMEKQARSGMQMQKMEWKKGEALAILILRTSMLGLAS